MTSAQRVLAPGMRVVVRDGPWPEPRIAGHYGKVVELGNALDPNYIGEVHVEMTGHIDGQPPHPIFAEDLLMKWFYADELDVID
jgi:hypothetical protein